ncbi:hypothetical protein HDV00_007852 [Rhizophlyctis rosea]|nr:hypothetical protein HDV00_007852 [Rhizophlyctis rosea]
MHRERSPSPIDLFELDLDAETTNEQMTFLTKPENVGDVDLLGGETPPSGFVATTLSRGIRASTLGRNPQQTDWKSSWDDQGSLLRDLLPASALKESPIATPASLDWTPALAAEAQSRHVSPLASPPPTTTKRTKVLDLSKIPVQLVEAIISHVAPFPNLLSCLLVSKSWSKAAARSLYRCPPLTTTDNFHLLVITLLNPGSYSYSSFVLDLHVPPSLSEHLLMGDIDVALQLCPNLRGIRLENCFTASNILMQSLGDHGRHLRRLRLRGCPISDVLLADLARACPKLEIVDLAHTNVTAAALVTLVDACDRIRYVDLEGCAQSTRSVSFDPRRTSKRPLRYLNVRNGGLTDVHIRFIAERCPQLSTIILEGCSSVTDDAVINLVRYCGETLSNADFSFCMKITDLSLRALAQYGKRLEVLTLSGCDLITPDGVQAITRGCPRMDEIVLHGCAKILSSFVREYSSRQYELDCAIRGPAVKWLAGHRTETAVVKKDNLVSVSGPEPASKEQGNTVVMVDQMIQTDALPKEVEVAASKDVKEETQEGEAKKEGTPEQANANEVLLKFAEAIAAGKWFPGGFPMPGPAGPAPVYGYGPWSPGPWGDPSAGGGGYGFPHPAWTPSPGAATPDASKRISTMSDASTTSGYSSMRSSFVSTSSVVDGDGTKQPLKPPHKRHSSGAGRVSALNGSSPSPPLQKRLSTESASSVTSTASRLKAPTRLPAPKSSRLPPPSSVSRGAIPRASGVSVPTPTTTSNRTSLSRTSSVSATSSRNRSPPSSPAVSSRIAPRPVGSLTASRTSSVRDVSAPAAPTPSAATSTAYKPRGFRKFNNKDDFLPSRTSTTTRPVSTSTSSTSTSPPPTPGTPKRPQHPLTPSRTNSGWIPGGTQVDDAERIATPGSSSVRNGWVPGSGSGGSGSSVNGPSTPGTPRSGLKTPTSVGSFSGLRPPTVVRTPSSGAVRTVTAKR